MIGGSSLYELQKRPALCKVFSLLMIEEKTGFLLCVVVLKRCERRLVVLYGLEQNGMFWRCPIYLRVSRPVHMFHPVWCPVLSRCSLIEIWTKYPESRTYYTLRVMGFSAW